MPDDLSKFLTASYVATKLRAYSIVPSYLELLDGFEIDKWMDQVKLAVQQASPGNIDGMEPVQFIRAVADKVKEAMPGLAGSHVDERALMAALAIIDREVRPERYSQVRER